MAIQNNDIVNRYKKITNGINYVVPEFTTYNPTPTNDDYLYGVIYRYFLRKRNDDNGIIYEINSDTNEKLKNDPLYLSIGIRWKISGDLDEVKKVNKKSTDVGAKTISNLHNYVKNYSKFWKG